MKTIISLFLLFGFLLIGHLTFPYENPCENTPTNQGTIKVDKIVNRANYKTLEDHQITRLESGAAYDFSHDSSVAFQNDPVFFDGAFNDDTPSRADIYSGIDSYLNPEIDLKEETDFKQTISERIEAIKAYRHQPSLYTDDEWSKRHNQRPKLESTP